jgi:PAS domain S-box-containing protein
MPEIRFSEIPAEPIGFLKGGGEMGALMRNYNWEAHPLGNPAYWSQSLKTHIRLLLNSGFPMFIWWSKDLYAFHNDAYLPALGKKHPEALGTSAYNLWAEIWGDIGEVVEGLMQQGKDFYAEELLLFLERKGFSEETYWTFSYSPAFNDAGEVDGIFCACFEFTHKVLGQRRLKTLKDISDAKFQIQTLEQACQSVCDILNQNPNDIPFNMIYLLNGTGSEARLFGLAGEIDPTTAPPIIDLTQLGADWPLAYVLQSHQLVIIDKGMVKPAPESLDSFSDYPNRAVIVPILKPGQDQLLGFLVAGLSTRLEYDLDYQGFHELITGQIATALTSVQAREEIFRHQEYLHEIFQQAPVAITILRGPQFIVDLANPGMCELWGRQPEEVLGKPILEAMPEIINQGILQLLMGVYQTGVPYVNTEFPIILNRNGNLEQSYFSFVYHPMRNNLGEITGVIAVAISMKEQVEARHEIEEMNRELLAINADLDNFVYSASHDLKAPISNIEGLMEAFVEYLPSETLALEDVRKLISLINSSIERFKRTVTDLTQVARIQREAGADVARLDLAEIISEVQLDFESVIAESGAQISTDLAAGSFIQFSAKNVRSVIYNLLSNALKYRADNRPPHISITTESTPNHLVLTVADNGLGINLADQNKMFSMFKRLHDHVEGTGIGLYIVKKIVDNAGGRIEVESEVGVGTTFKIYFRQKSDLLIML